MIIYLARGLLHGSIRLRPCGLRRDVAEGHIVSRNHERVHMPNSSLQHLEFAVMPCVVRGQPRTRGRFTLLAELVSVALVRLQSCLIYTAEVGVTR